MYTFSNLFLLLLILLLLILLLLILLLLILLLFMLFLLMLLLLEDKESWIAAINAHTVYIETHFQVVIRL
jgi:hypothetical protein